MNHRYDIPRVQIRGRRGPVLVLAAIVVALFLFELLHHVDLLTTNNSDRFLMVIWTTTFTIAIVQLALSWRDVPRRVHPSQQSCLDGLSLTVNIPVFNEDPFVLDRALFALFRQTRLPDRVQVVDDGSRTDYSEVRDWWLSHHPVQVDFSWIRQENQGKRHAQAMTFRDDPADIFVTLDSDTALEENAIHEGLKPFADPAVQCVAGLELAYNQHKNWLTRINGLRQLAWQLSSCAAQSVMGNVLVNRGTFAIYRGSLVRDHLDVYLAEYFYGARVPFGDDSLLTTFALSRGKAVQQPSAIQLTMYPENLDHHLRQWTRWMRSSTIRTFWRIRYLSPVSYGWLVTVVNLWLFFASTVAAVAALIMWPLTHQFFLDAAAAPVVWTYLATLRIFIVKRSDETLAQQFDSFALVPLSFLWLLLVLKPLRLWGMSTCRRTGWGTRAKVEVGIMVHAEEKSLSVVGDVYERS